MAITSLSSSMPAIPPKPTLPPPTIPLTQDDLKRIAAYKAVDFVQSGMILGLGTGSTATYALSRIAELLQKGFLKNVIGIPTSKKTETQALALGIPLSDLDTYPVLDLGIDGADEVDIGLNLVKGRGGSLLREKMVESVCKKFVVIVDESKMVGSLGENGGEIPVEVVPFCWKFTEMRLERMFKELGCVAKLRTVAGREIVVGENGVEVEVEVKVPFVTDNANYIVNLYLKEEFKDLSEASDAILRIPGVVEHGMFINMASTVIVAGKTGVTVKNM